MQEFPWVRCHRLRSSDRYVLTPANVAIPSESLVSFRAIVWISAITVAFALDRPLATFLHRTGIDDAVKFGGLPTHTIKLAGLCWYTLIVAIALLIWHPMHWRAAVFECCCCILAGTNSIDQVDGGTHAAF